MSPSQSELAQLRRRCREFKLRRAELVDDARQRNKKRRTKFAKTQPFELFGSRWRIVELETLQEGRLPDGRLANIRHIVVVAMEQRDFGNDTRLEKVDHASVLEAIRTALVKAVQDS